MTPEDIAAARAMIATGHHAPHASDHECRLGWAVALDEVERSQMEIAALRDRVAELVAHQAVADRASVALTARIRELEGALGDAASQLEAKSDRDQRIAWAIGHREILAKGAVLP